MAGGADGVGSATGLRNSGIKIGCASLLLAGELEQATATTATLIVNTTSIFALVSLTVIGSLPVLLLRELLQ